MSAQVAGLSAISPLLVAYRNAVADEQAAYELAEGLPVTSMAWYRYQNRERIVNTLANQIASLVAHEGYVGFNGNRYVWRCSCGATEDVSNDHGMEADPQPEAGWARFNAHQREVAR